MADIVVNTRLDQDLHPRFNGGDRDGAVVAQLVRLVGGDKDDSQLDADLKPVYTAGQKQLASLLQVLRIVQQVKAPPAAPTIVAADAPANSAAAGSTAPNLAATTNH